MTDETPCVAPAAKNPGADRSCALAIDAGGSYFKSGLVDRHGGFISESAYIVAVNSNGSRDEVLAAYAAVITRSQRFAWAQQLPIVAIGVSTPGPFDFRRGRSLMEHKFRCLYEVDLAAEIRAVGELPEEMPVSFVHDVFAFIKGEIWSGNGRGFERVVGITLGTGLGFGCSLGKRILENSTGGPHLGLYKVKWGEGILEDRISKRGILHAYRECRGEVGTTGGDVKELADRARRGEDSVAAAVFLETGQLLAESLVPICSELEIECVLFGGQISNAFDLFESGLRSLATNVKSIRCMTPGAMIERAALVGAAAAALANLPERNHCPDV